jgi:dipeptidyl aminopeptidase/acylaminoacyl peptidase
MRAPSRFVLALLAFVLAPLCAQDAVVYRSPPEPIASLVAAEPPPSVSLSPCRRFLLLEYGEAMPAIDVLSRPHLKLAGLRVDATTHGPQLGTRTTKLVLRTLADDSERTLDIPAGHIGQGLWSADGERIAFTRTTDHAIELWIATTATATVRKIPDVTLNAVLGAPAEWLPDQKTLLCRLVVDVPLPPEPRAPAGPNVQETKPGEKAQVRTNPDMLQSEYDARCFEALATCQLARIDADGGTVTKVGVPALLDEFETSPDGEYLLAGTVERPFSFLVGVRDFPRRTEVWTKQGAVVRVLHKAPLRENVPIGGVPTGPRGVGWLYGHPHALRWTEALDGGDPNAEADPRDRVVVLPEPVAEPQTWFQTKQRAMGVSVAADGHLALAGELDRKQRRMKQWRLDAQDLSAPPVLLYERSMQDVYGDPGQPIAETRRFGQRPLRQRGDLLFRSGAGQSKDGSRPFLDSWNPVTGAIERLWQCADGRYETFAGYLDDERILIRSESPTEPPNYIAVSVANGARKVITTFRDPAQDFASKIEKRLLRYQRSDGVALSGTLYLPPGHEPGKQLPALVWAYPQEFTQASDAGQVRAAPTRYTRFAGISHLWLLLAGYAVLDDAAMPIVGPQRTANDTFVQQLVQNAEASIKALADTGIVDVHRVAVGGHSYGAFMTANLLCHTDVFAAGIARSGAYNRSLTPFGFQNEERTYWEAPEVYQAMSPFAHADKIKEPILLIHGEDDNNQGTWPIQSQRLFAAIKGHGGTARLCMLPHEAHGYRAKESTLHCLAEMVDWMDRWVKNRPVPKEASGGK